MQLIFPNPSRSFDATRNCVRFWGYDATIEVSFFVEPGVFTRLCPEIEHAESGYLKAFDAARKRIYKVASAVYSHGERARRGHAFVLSEKDFAAF